jgi:hypothetical protein
MPGLSPEDRQRILDIHEEMPRIKYRVLAAKFGCSISHIASIINGRLNVKPIPKPREFRPPNMAPGLKYTQLTAGRAR